MVKADIDKPNYDLGIFRVVPTIVSECLKVDLDEPYSNWIFRYKEYLKFFEEADVNIVVVIDSLGASYLKGFLKELWVRSGEKILSSIIPTTTASAVGSIYIGLPPEISGLIAMRFYVPEIGNFINALHGKVSRQGFKDSLSAVGVKLSSFLWNKSVLKHLNSNMFKVIDLLPERIIGGLSRFYEDHVLRLSYSTEIDSYFEFRDIVKRFVDRGARGIIFVYIDVLDQIGHKFGVSSEEFVEEMHRLNLVVKKMHDFIKDFKGADINMYILSDHGQIDVAETLFIEEDNWKKFKDSVGDLEYVSSERFAFLYVKEGEIDSKSIEEFFENKAIVLPIEEGIKLELWPALDSEYLEKFLKRAGDFIILLKNGIEVKFKRNGRKVDEFIEGLGSEYRAYRGGHGGATKDELFVPFIPINNKS